MAYIKTKSINSEFKKSENYYSPTDLLQFAKEHKIKTEPLDIVSLVESLGLTVRYEPLENETSGSLKKDKKTGRWIISVNSLHHPHRQRFTIAHELAHYFEHTTENDTFTDKIFFRGSKFSSEEKQANKYAAELLMPEKSFREQVVLSPKIEHIAKYFQVSSAAIMFRAKELGYTGKSE